MVLSAYKDLFRIRNDIRELEVMLVPIRRRVYRFQLEEDEATKTWGITAHGPPRRTKDPRDYGDMLEDGNISMSTDRVPKRERKLKDLLRRGKSFEGFCNDWFTWLVQQQDEESKMNKQTNSSAQTDATSTPPNESS